MVSVADVYAEVGRQFSDDVDLHYLGELNVQHWTAGMERLLRFRAEHGDDRFYDIDFRAVQRDPIGQVRGLYAWLDEPVTDAFEAGHAPVVGARTPSSAGDEHPSRPRATSGSTSTRCAGVFADVLGEVSRSGRASGRPGAPSA